MRRRQSRVSVVVTAGIAALTVLAGAPAWAADNAETSAGTPAILAALNTDQVTVLDDRDAMAVRGQGSEYRYVLVRILGLNTLDVAPGLEWTWNLFGYRYGAWGGPGWTNGGRTDVFVPPADAMDAFFKWHDLGLLSDLGLLVALGTLPNVDSSFWGRIYVPAMITPGSELPVDKNVWVSGSSLFAGRSFFGWSPMPFTEYSRRQAVTAMRLLVLLP